MTPGFFVSVVEVVLIAMKLDAISLSGFVVVDVVLLVVLRVVSFGTTSLSLLML